MTTHSGAARLLACDTSIALLCDTIAECTVLSGSGSVECQVNQ